MVNKSRQLVRVDKLFLCDLQFLSSQLSKWGVNGFKFMVSGVGFPKLETLNPKPETSYSAQLMT